jgi:hypothetical protein
MMGIFETVALALIAAASLICSIFLWAWLSQRNDQQQRMFDFTEKQLEELYSPLLGILDQVGAMKALQDRVAGEFSASAHDESNRSKNELMSCYKRMLEILREKFWLAEDSTRERFQILVQYVEIYERALNRAIPVEVIGWLNVREAELEPLYTDLEQTSRNLRSKLTKHRRCCLA